MNDLDAGHVSSAVASILIEEIFGYHTINRSSSEGQGHHEEILRYIETFIHAVPAILICSSVVDSCCSTRFHRSYLWFR